MYLKFSNQGEVSPKAFTLLGASTKRDDNSKIGMFGSGNKYALAYFLRNGYEIAVFSGIKKIDILTKVVTFGGKTFEVITVDGQETSITTESGPQWKLWHAIRELYSNAMDEGVIDFGMHREIDPKEGETSIYIKSNPEIEKFMDNIAFYFSFDTTFITKSPMGKILEKSGNTLNLFRKGIRCYDTERKSIYDYDIQDIEINESRIIATETKGQAAVWMLIMACDSVPVIKNILENLYDDVYENNNYLNYWSAYRRDFSAAWDEALKGHYVAPSDYGGYVPQELRDKTYYVPDKLYKAITKKWGMEKSALRRFNDGEKPYQEIDISPLLENSVKRVEEFFNDCGFFLSKNIKPVKFMNQKGYTKTFYFYDDDHLLIDESIFDSGLQQVAEAVLLAETKSKTAQAEEYSHKKMICRSLINYMKIQNANNI